MKAPTLDRRNTAGPWVKNGWLTLVVILLAAVLAAAALPACTPIQTGPPAMAPCSTCNGSGVFGPRSCPSCRGIGFVRIVYRYPVVDPVK
ncbi:MAG: hypothetical protein ACYS47_12220 [Planctomycetota bacterium]|jgi:hypothetical protein